MKTSFVFRRAIQAILPATLLLAACSKSDTPTPTPAASTARIAIFNGAANVNVAAKVLVDEAEKASLNYGQFASYQTINAGTPTFKIVGGTTVLSTQPLTIDKDKSYSFFAYNPGPTNATTGLLVADDLTAPATTPAPGKAKIRLVHIAQGLGTNSGQGTALPINLSEAQTVGYADRIPNVAFGTASNFLEINAGTFNLAITTGTAPSNTFQFNVGDGSGSGTGTKAFEAGKIYTIIVRGAESNLDTTLKPKAYIVPNN
ncbi:DUF4397 domain-containing protein [Hymenobacter negativus]|uniref:DUF4397 domain-containing protein n=1 Tax=Hymenobacter negativus TaxID=2795026 RepID=A0ABS0QBB9_9BACT|nr:MULTISPECIES: DUF4397 domain-containing protein [Bacteria]MBH8559971.1 DUF4397 domain-containing protein [Hymenobacter negativus]MBH8570607.1 DUF4397 domain-containing protein [Hymenobacter negativus]MBR7210345.1 DUF4397 domain-containing protein [Microvirga sp. STS02]